MRVCPKCGHEDPIWWRPAAFHPEFSYAHNTSLESLEPELWALLKDLPAGAIVTVGPYHYWKSSRSDTTRRIWVEDFKMVGKKGSPQERVRNVTQLTLAGSPRPREGQ